MEYTEFYEMIYTKEDPKDPWYTFFQTRDWYHIPNNIRENEWLYNHVQGVQRYSFEKRASPHFVYPKDLQYIYDCTPDEALMFINEVRVSLKLSVSGPITIFDLQKYTQLDLQTILNFITES